MLKLTMITGMVLLCVFVHAQEQPFALPQKGFTSWLPAANWEHALLSGNGTMGAMVIGQPHDETIILSHALLYLPRKRSPKLINQAARLDEIRSLTLQGKFGEAANIPDELRRQEEYTDERDPFIPAFDIRLQQEPANISRYQRSVNFATGEAIVDWRDDKGTFQRKLFVSRKDSVIVLSVKGTAKINATIAFERRPVEWNQWEFVNAHVQNMQPGVEGTEWLHYRTEFKIKNQGAVQAYEGLGKLVATNGTVSSRGNALVISNADEVLLLVKIQPLYETASGQAALKQSLNRIAPNYYDLLARHVAIHGELFNRVCFQLKADDADRRLHTEEILLKAKTAVSLAMIEKAFDAGRYNIISATGINPPNLQGIWSGTWQAPWAGSMTHDGNLPTAIAMNLPGNMPELMQAYFNYHERLLDDYRTAARRLYNCRGIHIPAQATTTGLDTDFGETWCLTFWTGGAGWAANFYWDYYQYTLDKDFLAKRAYPFMKEAAQFYEDFLTAGTDGKLVFNPSYSPENNPANSASQAAINATMDVMIAKQLLRNCVDAASILQVDKDKIKLWQSMLAKMPAYERSNDGALREWLWKDLQENHGHRHASHLYALFDEVEPEFAKDDRLRAAAAMVMKEKMQFREQEGGGEMAFGLVQLGAAAAHLGDNKTSAKLLQWLASRYWSTGMGSFHNVGHLFNTDISGGLPYLITQMLAYSEQGFLSLLPALPAEWKEGRIEGLLLRGNITLKNLQWNGERVEFSLQAPTAQKLEIRLPFAISVEESSGIKLKEIKPGNSIETILPANKEVRIAGKRVL